MTGLRVLVTGGVADRDRVFAVMDRFQARFGGRMKNKCADCRFSLAIVRGLYHNKLTNNGANKWLTLSRHTTKI
jgi:hypothetical protein